MYSQLGLVSVWLSLCLCVFVSLWLVFKINHKDTKTQRNHREYENRVRRFSRFIALSALTLVAAHDNTKPPAQSVKCELVSTKHLAISAKINGKGPFRFIFDTGSPVVLLNTKVAREAEIAKVARGLPKAKNSLPGQTLVQSIDVGGAKAENVPVAVFDHPTLAAIESIVGPVDGIIGYPFFARFKTTIDYPALQLTFQPNGHMPEDAIQTMMKALMDRGKKKSIKAFAAVAQLGLEVEKPDEQPGVRIKTLFAGSAAANAGFRTGDRLLTIDGRWTDSRADCVAAVADLPAARAVAVAIQRGQARMTLEFVPNSGF